MESTQSQAWVIDVWAFSFYDLQLFLPFFGYLNQMSYLDDFMSCKPLSAHPASAIMWATYRDLEKL